MADFWEEMNEKYNSIKIMQRLLMFSCIGIAVSLFLIIFYMGINNYIVDICLLWLATFGIMASFIEGPTRWDTIPVANNTVANNTVANKSIEMTKI